MYSLQNYILGNWETHTGKEQILYNAYTAEAIATTTTNGINFKDVVDYGRKHASLLSNYTFRERGLMLKALALHLQKHLPKFYEISYKTGATKADSWVDIEGGIGNLFAYASLRRKLPDDVICLDGEYHNLSKGNSFMGHHILVPKQGVAIHINAFNFPVWGMLEKIAVNILAGMPCIVKPATVTSYLTEAVVKEIIASNILPKGTIQLICGSAGDLLNHVQSQDVVTFTGSATTGLLLKSNPFILKENVPFTMEADSLNCIVLGEDVTPEMPEWDIFIKEVRKEMTTKCGQKCTAIRRIFVPENKIEAVQKDLQKALAQTVIGNPLNKDVRMGSLAGESQRNEVKEQVQKLLAASQIIYGSLDSIEVIDADGNKGAFMSPILLLNEKPFTNTATHHIEAFGPVSSVMPYKSIDEAIELSKMGMGSLVSTIVTANTTIARKYIIGAAAYHGRVLILNSECAKESTGHGSPLPLLVHGGPGRAGGSEEMGGLRGIKHYMQRVAVQGSPNMITAISNVYQPNASGKSNESIHPFKKYFEELEIGDQVITAKRIITKEDINQFADLSGDHFYAHNESTNFEGTMFTHQVAHGYFVMSAAAGLFVDDDKLGPVLLNYGIDELRFTKPVYPGAEIFVRFTCKEKIIQDKKEEENFTKGIVKWYVEIIDETVETVGVATILTMVKCKES
ncbi:MAG: phenylacetic acid degradation bifunctional protein PaaZ [Chitinophagaceae bacterium]